MADPRGNIVPFPVGYDDDAPVESFEPFYPSRITDAPKPREWLVDGLLMRGTVALFAGPPKIGKSMVLQQLLTCIALGRPWLERETVAARTFGLFTEDPQDEMERRQLAINDHYTIDPGDLGIEFSWDARDTKDGTLVTFDRYSDRPMFTPLWDQLWNHCEEDGVEVVGLDPTGVIFGGNENFKRQVIVFVRELHKKAARVNGAVVLSAHPAKSDPRGFAGSNAWLGSVRMGMSMQPTEVDPKTGEWSQERILRSLGANYTPGRMADRLRWDRGVFVLEESERAKPLDRIGKMDLQYRLMQGMRRVIENGGRLPADEMHRDSIASRARRSRDPLINRIPLNDLYTAQDDLLASGHVIRVEVDRRCLLRPADGPNYGEREKPWIIAST